jgi:RNA polymerase sigma factor (sigma-70 family)
MKISDEEFLNAYNDPDSRRIINSISRRFARRLSPDDLESCAQVGVFRCLRQHDPNKQRFTTSLYRFVTWECLTALRSAGPQPHIPLQVDVAESPSGDDATHIHECISLLRDPYDRDLVRRRYLEGQSYTAIAREIGKGRETARRHVGRATARLASICRAM